MKNNNIPDNIREKLEDIYKEILENENIKIKKKSNHGRNIGKIVAALVVIMVVGMITPVLADNVYIFKSMSDKIRQVLEINDKSDNKVSDNKEKDLIKNLRTENIGVSSKNNGLEMTLDRGMYDGINIYIEFTIKTDKAFKESNYSNAVYELGDVGSESIQFYVDKFNIDGNDEDYSYDNPDVKFINDKTLKGYMIIETDSIYSDKIDVDTDIKIPENNSKMDSCRFKFSLNNVSSEDNLKTIEINDTKNGFTLKQVVVSQSNVIVKMKLPDNHILGKEPFESIIIKDNEGRKLEESSGEKLNEYDYIGKYELNNIGDKLKYINISIYGEESKIITKFKVYLK